MLGSALAILVAIIGLSAWYGNKPDMVPLFTNMEAKDAGEVAAKLKESKIEDQIKKAQDLLSQIWYEMGQYYENIDPKPDNCEKSYLESVNNDNTNIQALLGLSYTLMSRGKFGDAQIYINMLLKEDESNEEGLALLVSVLNAKKDNESALDYLVGMIQRQPNSYHLIELYISLFNPPK